MKRTSVANAFVQRIARSFLGKTYGFVLCEQTGAQVIYVHYFVIDNNYNERLRTYASNLFILLCLYLRTLFLTFMKLKDYLERKFLFFNGSLAILFG